MKKFFFVAASLAILSCSSGEERFMGIFQGPPRIHEPAVVGNRPGTPFLFAVPTSGQRPVKWSASDLPDGLSIDGAGNVPGVECSP